MKLREILTVAAFLAMAFLTYAYMQDADAKSACRDWQAINGRAGP